MFIQVRWRSLIMMTRYGICPVCGSHIPEHRHEDTWVLCECGWLGSKNEEIYEKGTQKKAITWIVSISLFILGGFVHTTRWGNDFISVIPYQAQVYTGTASDQVRFEFAELSIKHRLYEQGESHLTTWAESVNTPESWEKVAVLRTQMKNYNSAVLAFDKYYELQGNNPLTMFQYAQVLEKLSRPDLAEKIYLHIVGLDTETYQRTVVEELVRLLVNQQRLKEAQSILAQLSKPNMDLPSHLIRQKEFIEQLLEDQNKPKTEKSNSSEIGNS